MIGVVAHSARGLSTAEAVAYGLVVVWLLTGLTVGLKARAPTGEAGAAPILVLVGALAASTALVAAHRAAGPGAGHHRAAQGTATLAGLAVIAVSWHLLLSLPHGRLGTKARSRAVWVAYAAAAGAGLVLVITRRSLSVGAGAAVWSGVVVAALPGLRLAYGRSVGHDRELLQWTGVGALLSADVAAVAAVLHLLVGWPTPLFPVAAGATVGLPLGMIAGSWPALGPQASRVLVRVLSLAGFTVVVSVVYVVIVAGLAGAPNDRAGREVLGLSILAAAVAAVTSVPLRNRLVASATQVVYGARQAPDEVLRTFGSRLTRAVSMDELLLQMGESLRRSMRLSRAEVYTGSADVLERAVSVPDSGPRTIVVTARERPAVTRAGTSGNAWIAVWLPELLDDRRESQLRVTPISYAGELLGLIVLERPATADAFSMAEDQVLSDLARQVGLALHNSRLDTALHTTLDELRQQAEALRESRARIVASGDAERRRVERDLHDGAQQSLVAMAVKLRLARDIIASDLAGATQLLDQLEAGLQQTIREIRDLAHGIYPPLLADTGLLQALRSAAHRNPLPVVVDGDDIGRYRPEIEAAVYFCCLEALQNAAKHASGATVEIRLWEDSGGLLFTVGDDGPGFDTESTQRGHGFVNMSDRLGAIGGTVRWESQPGRGVRIQGSIPLA